MRRYWEEQRPRPVLNASLALRLLCGVGMLALVAMLVVRMGEPELWRWMAGDNGRSATAAVDESSRPIPEATGPTDQDPDQTAIAREEFQVLTDGALKLQQPEMEPYYRLVAWSKKPAVRANAPARARRPALYPFPRRAGQVSRPVSDDGTGRSPRHRRRRGTQRRKVDGSFGDLRPSRGGGLSWP